MEGEGLETGMQRNEGLEELQGVMMISSPVRMSSHKTEQEDSFTAAALLFSL